MANVTANKGETAVHGDMAVRIRWVQARPWDGMRVTCLQFVLLETMNLLRHSNGPEPAIN